MLVLLQMGLRVVNANFALVILASCLADGASQVGEFVDVFDLFFTQADCFCLSCVGSHCLCFLGVDLQAGVPCGDAEALCTLLYVLK